MPYGWIYPKNSFLREIVDPFLHKLMESGIFLKQEKVEPLCVDDEFAPVDSSFVTTMFAILIFGIFVSVSIFCVERIYKLRSGVQSTTRIERF